MDIKLEEKTVREVCNGYVDSAENGVDNNLILIIMKL